MVSSKGSTAKTTKTYMEKCACLICHVVDCRPWRHEKAKIIDIQGDENKRSINSDIETEETIENSLGTEKKIILSRKPHRVAPKESKVRTFNQNKQKTGYLSLNEQCFVLIPPFITITVFLR